MYIKLRYRARLARPSDVETLADEVEDICRSNGWKYNRWHEDWSKPSTLRLEFDGTKMDAIGHAPLRGISFSPHPDCETVWLTFTPDGNLNSLHTLADPNFTVDSDTPGYWWNRVKTGFDGAKSHLAICRLFFFLEKKYFADLQGMDESGYWRHRDEARFEEWMASANRGSKILDDELAILFADETIPAAQKKEAMYNLYRQFGERHRPDLE